MGIYRILNEVLSITAQEWLNRRKIALARVVLNEVLSITAQEFYADNVPLSGIAPQ